MSDVPNRAELERKLARVIGRDMRSELDKLMELLGDPPDIMNVPHEYWQNGWRGLQKDVEPILIDVFLGQAEGIMRDVGIGVDWAVVNTIASTWSKQHSESVLKRMFDKTYEGINQTIPEFYEQGLNLGELKQRLERWYSPVRAEMIAITETTRAAVEGERALVEELEKQSGIHMIPYWMTNRDETVCPTCGPKDNKEIVDGVFPPEHPNCRCWVVYRFPKRK